MAHASVHLRVHVVAAVHLQLLHQRLWCVQNRVAEPIWWSVRVPVLTAPRAGLWCERPLGVAASGKGPPRGASTIADADNEGAG